MRSFTTPGAPGRCQRCLLLLDFCLCSSLGEATPSLPRVLVVRHHWEAWKTTNTARVAGLALSNLRLLDMAEDPEPVRAELRRLENAWFLYPGHGSGTAPAEPPSTLVVLDGTWRQTRKMLKRLPELASLPHFSLDDAAPGAARERLREPPRPGARSTLEAIADALRLLDSPACGERLLELHRLFVRQTLRSRGKKSSPAHDS
jgi:DTW domain-containing protein YfiP